MMSHLNTPSFGNGSTPLVSSEHDFIGEDMIMRRTSVVVQGRNDSIVDDARLVIGAGGTPAVDARMSSIFRAKNLASSSAEWPVTPATSRSRPNSVDNERHS